MHEPQPPDACIAQIWLPAASGAPVVVPESTVVAEPVTAPLNVAEAVAFTMVPFTEPPKVPVNVAPFAVVPVTVPVTLLPLIAPLTLPVRATDDDWVLRALDDLDDEVAPTVPVMVPLITPLFIVPVIVPLTSPALVTPPIAPVKYP